MLALEGIRKTFGALTALDQVAFAVKPGTIHGLLGENGAGKTTLMRILLGLERPDAGRILLDGRVLRITSPRQARAQGIGMVHQHFALVPTLGVAQNLALSTGGGLGLVRPREILRSAEAVAERLGWRLPVADQVGALSVGAQQRLEIISALMAGGRYLILDEPTAPLTPAEAAELFTAMQALAAQGAGIVFISHKLNEVDAVCSQVTILRRGRVVHDAPIAGLSRSRIAELLVGATVTTSHRRASAPPGAVRLRARGLTDAPRVGRPAFADIELAVRAGEIVGIAGVDGNGQAELVTALLGLDHAHRGEVVLDAGPLAAVAAHARRAIGVIPQDRRRDGLALHLPVVDNLLLKAARHRDLSPWGFVRRGRWRAQARHLVQSYDIRLAGIDQAVIALSGGNQQKVVLARELSFGPALVIACNPTRGLDIGASATVLENLVAARARGAAILLVHSDLDELLAIADRVLVMSGGRLVDSLWPDASRERIGALMIGGGSMATGPGLPHA